MHRRRLLAALAASALAPGLASAAPPRVTLGEGFWLLADYLALPPERRDLFHLAYLARRSAVPAPDAQAVMVAADGTRTPFVFAADGLVTNLPTLDQLKSKAKFETVGPAFSIALEMRASIVAADRYDIAALTLALTQVNAAVAKFAYGEAVGRLTAVYFPDAGMGHATFADGHVAPLPVFTFPGLGPVPYLEPRKLAGAQAVQLDKPPSRILLAGPPRRP
jgi:prepilin-type processing-associated H-X9-DG protein